MSGRLLSGPAAGPAKPPLGRRIVRSPYAWGAGVIILAAIGTTVLIPSRTNDKHAPPSPLPPMASTPYVGPVMTPTPAAATVMPPRPDVKLVQPPPPPPAPETPRHLSSYSYGNGNFMPEYMKPHKEEATEQAAHAKADRGGINYTATHVAGIKSYTIPDLTYILPAFSTIPCIMETAVITGASGVTPFRCHMHGDVRAPKSRVVLFEDGTEVGGFYKSTVSEGDTRVVMVTAQAMTTNGVLVAFGDPVADMLGAAGVPGSVDEHWGKRIGGALLLSLADAGLQLLQAELQNQHGSNNNTTNLNLGSVNTSGLSSLAQSLLSKTINIPPTISVNQGAEIMLWTTQLIDFSDSYKVEVTR